MIKANITEKELREKLIKLALLQYHKLYVHGKNGPDTYDCAGLAWYLYNEICKLNLYNGGFGLSTTTKIMTNNTGFLTLFDEWEKNKDLSLIKEGDIVFFHRQSLNESNPTEFNKYPGHCGVYLGDYRFIHASRPKQKVIISDFTKNEYWKNVLVGFKNIIDEYLNEEKDSYIYKLK